MEHHKPCFGKNYMLSWDCHGIKYCAKCQLQHVHGGQTNWNDVRKIYEDIKPSLLMVGHGCKCFFVFHRSTSLDKVTEKYIKASLWFQHTLELQGHPNNGQFGYNEWCHLFSVNAAIEDSLLRFYEYMLGVLAFPLIIDMGWSCVVGKYLFPIYFHSFLFIPSLLLWVITSWYT